MSGEVSTKQWLRLARPIHRPCITTTSFESSKSVRSSCHLRFRPPRTLELSVHTAFWNCILSSAMKRRSYTKGALAFTALYVVYASSSFFGRPIDADADDGDVDGFIMSAHDDAAHVRGAALRGPVRGDKQIFFTETTCAVTASGYDFERPTLRLDYHQACAIESAARAHPRSRIVLYYSCPLKPDSLSRSDALVRRVFELPNVRVWHQSAAGLFANTPLAALHASGDLRKSWFQRQHASDVVRMLILWKYGGTYLDLDFVVRRSMDDLAESFASTQNSGMMNGAALRLAAHGVGARVAAMCVDELRTNFRWYLWVHNGPELLTRVLRKLCHVDKIEDMTLQTCSNMSVLPAEVFYPIQWYERTIVYNEAESDVTMRRVADAHAVHLWMSLRGWSFAHALLPDSRQPLALLQARFCPIAHAYSSARWVHFGGRGVFTWVLATVTWALVS